jgi:Leucine-rich repeat (LRR) protein
LENCRISDVSVLSNLKSLLVLDLSNNQISDFAPLHELR